MINADSMQVYRDLRVLTARPTPEEEARVPHRLYGHVDAGDELFRRRLGGGCGRVLAEARAQNRLPIFVGGTGLYFKALTRGLSAVPPIPPEIRDGVRARLERDGVEALHAELARRDPASAATLEAARPHPHRARAGSGRSDRPLVDRLASRGPAAACCRRAQFRALFLSPEREALYARIDARFDAMLKAGALEEVAALAARNLDPLLPAMKAHGVPALIRHLAGRAHAATRRLRSAAPTPATMPSGSSPGSGINCRSSNGSQPEAAREWLDRTGPPARS